MDKYNFINSAEGSEKPQAALGTSPAPGKLMQWLNSSREMLTYVKKYLGDGEEDQLSALDILGNSVIPV